MTVLNKIANTNLEPLEPAANCWGWYYVDKEGDTCSRGQRGFFDDCPVCIQGRVIRWQSYKYENTHETGWAVIYHSPVNPNFEL